MVILDTGGRNKTSADCLLEACPPPPEPNCHKLDQWQLRRLCCLLATIAERELPLKPYFQDYELVNLKRFYLQKETATYHIFFAFFNKKRI